MGIDPDARLKAQLRLDEVFNRCLALAPGTIGVDTSDALADYEIGSWKAELDGRFTVDQLEALAAFMRACQND